MGLATNLIEKAGLSQVLHFGDSKSGERLPPGHDWIQLIEEQQYAPHFLLGKTGTGKTHVQRQYIWYALKNVMPVFAFDPERQLYQEFGKEEDTVLNVEHLYVPYWELHKEFKGVAQAQTLARCILSNGGMGIGGPNDIFYDWACDALGAALERLRVEEKLSTIRLYEYLAEPDKFKDLLKGTAYDSILPEKAPEQRAAVMGMLARLATPMRLMPEAPSKENKPFSINGFIDQCKRQRGKRHVVWVTTLSNSREAVQPLYTSWFATLFRAIMSGEDPLYMMIVCDEIQLMDRIKVFREACTNIRKRRSILVFGTQTMEQGELIYPKEWNTIANMAGVLWLLATSGKGTDELVDSIGRETYVLADLSEAETGQRFEGNRLSRSVREHEKHIVSESDLGGLANLQAYFCQRGFRRKPKDAGKLIAIPVEIPLMNLPKRIKPLIPRPVPDLLIKRLTVPTTATTEARPAVASQASVETAAASAVSTATPSISQQEQERQQREEEGFRILQEARAAKQREIAAAELRKREQANVRQLVRDVEEGNKPLTRAQRHNAKVFSQVVLGLDSKVMSKKKRSAPKQPKQQEEADED